MPEIIFCKTRHHYDSYTDLFRLVDLCGYPTIYVDEIPDAGVADHVYICSPLNGEWAGGVKTDGRVILWDLEWRDGLPIVPGVSEVWVGDRWYARRIGAKHVPVGSHPQLAPQRNWNGTPAWDFAMLAYMTHRRLRVCDGLEARNLRGAPNAWGHERDDVLRHSRCMLHVHQHDDTPTLAPQRWALAASSAHFLISEALADPWPFVSGEDFFGLEYEDLVAGTWSILKNDAGRDMAASLWHKACEAYRFDKVLEAAL